jgi:serine/threonine protein phosphatase PrpC
VRVRTAAVTDIGHVRERNEDRYLVSGPVVAVADGMGGHLGGEVAASLATHVLARLSERGEGSLADRVREANRVVFERSIQDRTVAGMGTTLTAAELVDGRARLAHVGDSRAYLFRDGELTRLTEDHTLVQQMVRAGELTSAQAEVHPHRNILTRVVGVDPGVEVDELEIELRPGDRLLLCTDGLTNMLPDARIAQVLGEEDEPRAAAERLVAEANQAGGIDNITVVLVDLVEEGHDEADPPARTSVGRAGHPAAGPSPARAGRAPAARALARAGVPIALALGMLVTGLVGLRLYLDSQWYVGVADGHVAVYRGIPAEVAGFRLHRLVTETEIPAEQAQALALYRELDAGITAADRAEAEAIVEQIRADLARLTPATEAP